MEKYLFLDFDGVINTEKSHYNFDPEKLKLLGKIIEATNCKIVISSSHRCHTLEATIDDLKDENAPFHAGITFPFCDSVVGITIRAYQYVKNIHLSIPRGVEIKQWIDTHVHSNNGKDWDRKANNRDYTYCILDDDSDMLLEHKDNFIQTDTCIGLTEDDVQTAIAILNKTL